MSKHSDANDVHTFGVSYYSEVSIEVHAYVEDGVVHFEARHPVDWPDTEIHDEADMVGLQSSWFHFGGTGPDTMHLSLEITDSERAAVFTCLNALEMNLYPGARMLISDQNPNCDDPANQFHNDLLYAFLTGGWTGAKSNIHEDIWLNRR